MISFPSDIGHRRTRTRYSSFLYFLPVAISTMAPTPNQYGSISGNEDKDATLELLPHGPSTDNIYNRSDSEGAQPEEQSTRHRCISLLLAAGICLVAARYWHDRADSYRPAPAKHPDVSVNVGDRVPLTPALSTLDPRKMKFRSVKREGLASPSKAWGDFLVGVEDMDAKADDEDVEFVPLPTNQWYLVRENTSIDEN